MTRKQKILSMIERLPDDVTHDRVMYHLDVMKGIEEGMEDIQAGRFVDHDELFDRLLKQDAQEKGSMEQPGGAQPRNHRATHQGKRSPKKGGRVRKAPAGSRPKARPVS